MAQEVSHLLWTGGWDSTFRLLNLLLIFKLPVQPYYVIDHERKGSAFEIRTMSEIREALNQHHPLTRKLLLPSIIVPRLDLSDDREVTDAMMRLRGEGRLGMQYDWLIRFARQRCPAPLELSIHRDDKAHSVLEDNVVRDEIATGTVARIVNAPANPDISIFRVFRFPLFDWTKRGMARVAAERGFEDFLERTWFCHSPLPNGQPCGTCSPCNYTREEGLGRRIPLRGRVRQLSNSLRRRLYATN